MATLPFGLWRIVLTAPQYTTRRARAHTHTQNIDMAQRTKLGYTHRHFQSNSEIFFFKKGLFALLRETRQAFQRSPTPRPITNRGERS